MNTLSKKTEPTQGRYSSKYGVVLTALVLAILITVLLLVHSVISQSNLNYICMNLETSEDCRNRHKVLQNMIIQKAKLYDT